MEITRILIYKSGLSVWLFLYSSLTLIRPSFENGQTGLITAMVSQGRISSTIFLNLLSEIVAISEYWLMMRVFTYTCISEKRNIMYNNVD